LLNFDAQPGGRLVHDQQPLQHRGLIDVFFGQKEQGSTASPCASQRLIIATHQQPGCQFRSRLKGRRFPKSGIATQPGTSAHSVPARSPTR
jgi:hypothetical protein